MRTQSAKLACSCLIIFFVLGCNRIQEGNVKKIRSCPALEQNAMQVNPGKIEWYYSFEDGLKTAQKENKPLMVDFTAEWCGWCKKLDTITYQQADVLAFSKNFISVKVDCDKEPAISHKYEVRGLPTIVFMSPEGQKIHQVVGYRRPEDFLLEMKKALR